MSAGAWMMVLVILVVAGALSLLLFSMMRSIQDHRTEGRSVWREFGLGLVLMLLFFATWIGQGIAEWQAFTDEQRTHDEPVEVGDFTAEFAQSTLENWQSEFLQLFSFVVLAALYIHKGSAESKDGTEKLEASLRRLEERMGTLPDSAPDDKGEQWQLPDSPLESEDEELQRKRANERRKERREQQKLSRG